MGWPQWAPVVRYRQENDKRSNSKSYNLAWATLLLPQQILPLDFSSAYFHSTAATSSPQQCWVCGAMERSTAIKISLTFNYWSSAAPRCIALTQAHLRSSLNLSQDALFAQFLIVDISTPPASSTFHSTFDSGNTSRHALHQQHPPLVVS